jgi:hypothetical protein
MPEGGVMSGTCRCGSTNCHRRNRSYFREQTPGPDIRAVVFWWSVVGDAGCWTWCPVIKGEPVDEGRVMGHFDTLQDAYAEARAYTCGEYREDA